MEINKQVCNLENAKRLKELGVKQESLFYFARCKNNPFEIIYRDNGYGIDGYDELYSAFTVAELGEMLFTKENCLVEAEAFAINQWVCDYETYRTFGETEADARASMLIYLLENNLIDNK